jgi:DNA (cytosine-5)-methyltransferase 1
MRLLDLYCCEGGAGTGYARAGFEVVGVDIAPQPDYPFEFVQGDAIEYARAHGHEFDAIHASPPCQAYTTMGNRKRLEWPDLIAPTRDALEGARRPYVIENVPGAESELRHPILLHGGMFELGVYRPRLFEVNFPILLMPPLAPQPRQPIGVYGRAADGRRLWTRRDGTELRAASSVAEAREAMGMPWASWNGLREAIPPAYTEWLGGELLEWLRAPHASERGA